MQPGTVSVTREIADLEAEVAKYEASNLALGEKLLSIQRQKRTVEEELVSENIRLKVVLDEHRERQQQDALPQNVSDRSVSQAELQTRIERALISVFEQKLHDRNWALEDGTTSTAAAHGWGGNQVRVEFEGAEVFWALLDSSHGLLLPRPWEANPESAARFSGFTTGGPTSQGTTATTSTKERSSSDFDPHLQLRVLGQASIDVAATRLHVLQLRTFYERFLAPQQTASMRGARKRS